MKSAPRYDPPVSFARIWELAHALGGDAELTDDERLEASIVLGDVAITFGGYRRRRGRPVSRTHNLAVLALQVKQRFKVTDGAAARAAAPEATEDDREAIERTMRKIRSGEVAAGVEFFDEAVDRAGARLGTQTGNK